MILEYTQVGNAPRYKYIYGPGIDEPIMMIEVDGETETRYYYHFDGLGSVAALTDANAVAIETYSYDVFGEVTIKDPNGTTLTESAYDNPYYFTGRRLDEETDLYYYRARIYNPEIGRFLQPDPIGYAAGMNIYTYCDNNPVNWRDPWGLFHFEKKPLDALKGIWLGPFSSNPIDDYFNTEANHEQGFFDDGSGDNIGYFDDSKKHSDDSDNYRNIDNEYYDDALMREALRNIEDGEYSLLGFGKKKKNNCQNWADRLRKEYFKLGGKVRRSNGFSGSW